MRSFPESTATSSPRAESHRLPRTIEPLTYRIELVPDLDAASFSGTVEIDVRVHEQTDVLVLNAAELEIHEAIVIPPAADPVSASVSLDEGAERAILRLPAPLAKGDATVRLAFSGVLNDKLRGFYRSTFTDDQGHLRTIATSQMEATDARRAFPCWDEPDRKATYEVTLVVDEHLQAYSNSPVVAQEPVTIDGRAKRRVRFGPTMKMSTYLVAFVVGPLQATDPIDVGGVPVRVVHSAGKANLAGFALDVARHALEFFSDYFDIPYPGEKLDLVAIPDFAYGAMENLGCVTFRETALLVDPHAAARVELERITDVVHHEVAHMWFGDLVTMGWWEGIWLNEAFATFMETLATDDYRPAWQRWTTFGTERDAALAVDGLHATRPIEYEVRSPEEADGMFDTLTYEKGASVLRMIEQYLGPDSFRDGVRQYLKTHAYGNTVTTDLWNALEEVSGEPVRAMADTWILQGGHPLVTARGGSLAQEPFSYLPVPPSGESAIGTQWLVPMLVRPIHGNRGGDHAGDHGDGQVHRLLLGKEPAALPPPAPGDAPILANAGGWGVYRVAYAQPELAALASALGELSPLERFGVLSDCWALVLAGRAELEALLHLGAQLGDDDDPAVFQVVAAALQLTHRVARAADRPLVESATRALLGPRAETLGWVARPHEGERVPTLRALLIQALGKTGADGAVRAEADRLFQASQHGSSIDPDIEAAVLAVVGDESRARDYEMVLERFRHAANPQQERRYLMALGSFSDVTLCMQSFDLALSEVRSQDGPFLVLVLLSNREGGPAVWERVKSHWQALLDRFPEVTHDRMLSSVRTLCTDPDLAADVKHFLQTHPLHTGGRSIAQTLEMLAVNVRFAQRMREPGRVAAACGTVLGF